MLGSLKAGLDSNFRYLEVETAKPKFNGIAVGGLLIISYARWHPIDGTG